jgi:hypothetical protein
MMNEFLRINLPDFLATAELEKAWTDGEFTSMRQQASPFFKERISDLQDFQKEFAERNIFLTAEMLLKLFVLRCYLPFDMPEYMKRQSLFIKAELAEKHLDEDNASPTERQQVIHQWIKTYAARHRREEILRQIFCIGKIHQELEQELSPFVNID